MDFSSMSNENLKQAYNKLKNEEGQAQVERQKAYRRWHDPEPVPDVVVPKRSFFGKLFGKKSPTPVAVANEPNLEGNFQRKRQTHNNIHKRFMNMNQEAQRRRTLKTVENPAINYSTIKRYQKLGYLYEPSNQTLVYETELVDKKGTGKAPPGWEYSPKKAIQEYKVMQYDGHMNRPITEYVEIPVFTRNLPIGYPELISVLSPNFHTKIKELEGAAGGSKNKTRRARRSVQ